MGPDGRGPRRRVAYPVNALFVFAGIELMALLVLVALILAAPEAVEDEQGFRVVGPSLWQRLRQRLAPPPTPSKVPPFPSMRGPTHA